jgi:CoA:oxalate CoA-transferase
MPSPTSGAPLLGLTIVDLGRVLAAPFATSTLASLGARVIKVERPGTGDDARAFGPHVNGHSVYFASVNCDKESIALDLTRTEDRTTFDELLERADVLVENFRPGTLARLGYSWQTLHARFPRLIYAAVSGFGATGPLSNNAAYDIIAQALSGMMSITGTPGAPPVRVGASIGDLVAGLYLALGIVSAVHRRSATGLGCMIDVAMLDSQVAFLEAAITAHTAACATPQPRGTRHPSIAPFQAFECAERWIVIAAGNDGLFRDLCTALGLSEVALDQRFTTNASRLSHIDALDAEITRMLRTRPSDHWLAALHRAGVPCAPIQTIPEMIGMEQIRARHMVIPIDDPQMPGASVPNTPIKMSDFEVAASRRRPPRLDEHGDSLRREFGAG